MTPHVRLPFQQKLISRHSLLFFLVLGLFSFSPAQAVKDGPGKQDPSSATAQVQALENFTPLQCFVVPSLMKGFLKDHLEVNRITAKVIESTIKNYIRWVAPSKGLLLEKEEQEYGKILKSLFDKTDWSQCGELALVQTQIVSKNKELEDFVREYLNNKSYKLDETTELNLDPEKQKYPKDAKERNEYLKKLVHFQISTYLESETPLEEAKRLLIHRYELFTKRAMEMKQDDLISAFLDSFARALDPHSSFLSPEVLEDFQIAMGLSLEGIGVSLTSKDGYTVIEEIIPGGAADQLKENRLKPKDKILSVASATTVPTNITDMELRNVVKLIRGKKGTPVTLTILRQGEKTEKFKATIIRDRINLEEQAAKLKIEKVNSHGKDLKLAVIDLPSFYGDKNRSSYTDIKNLIKKSHSEKIDGMILDLSRNSGGLLDESVRISGLFIRQGGIVATQMARREPFVLEDDDEEIQYNGPLLVLTSRLSASASEIVAGAIKDYKRGIIVGDDHTFGKGSVQSVLNLPRGLGALKITTGMYFRPGGQSTQWQGVSSDVELPSPFAAPDIGEKNLENSLNARQINNFLSKNANSPDPLKGWAPVNEKVLAQVGELSKKRVDANTEFKKIRDAIKERDKNNGMIKLSELLKKKGEKEKDKDKEKSDTKSRKERQEENREPQYKEALNILADYIAMNGITQK